MPEISERSPAVGNVLVECDEPVLHDGIARVLQEAGYDVVSCAGPSSRGSQTCPLVTDGRCTLVERADLVVHALDQAEPAHRDVLAALLAGCARADVVVEANALPGDDTAAIAPGAGVRTVPTFTRSSLLGSVVAANDGTE